MMRLILWLVLSLFSLPSSAYDVPSVRAHGLEVNITGRPVEDPCPPGFSVSEAIKRLSKTTVGPTYADEAEQALECYLSLNHPELDAEIETWLNGPLFGRFADYENDLTIKQCEGVREEDGFSDEARKKSWSALTAKVLQVAARKNLNFHMPHSALAFARPESAEDLSDQLKAARNKALRDSLLSLLATRKKAELAAIGEPLAAQLVSLLAKESSASPRLVLDLLDGMDPAAAGRRASQLLKSPTSTERQKDDAARHLADRHPALAKQEKAFLLENPILSPGADLYFLSHVEPQEPATFDSILDYLGKSPREVLPLSTDFYESVEALGQRYKKFSPAQIKRLVSAFAKHPHAPLRFIDNTDYPDSLLKPFTEISGPLLARKTDLPKALCETRLNPNAPAALNRLKYEARVAPKRQKEEFIADHTFPGIWDEATLLPVTLFLGDPDFDVRYRAAFALTGAMFEKTELVLPHLPPLLKDPYSPIRLLALSSLADVVQKDFARFAPPLFDALEDLDPKVHLTVGDLIGNIVKNAKDPKPLLPFLRKAVESKSKIVRVSTILPHALVESKGLGAGPAPLDAATLSLVSFLKDDSPAVRTVAVDQLARLGGTLPKEAVQALEATAKADSVRSIREDAFRAVQNFYRLR